MQVDDDSGTPGKMLGEFLGAVGGAVLPSRASEGNLKMAETPVYETLDMGVDQREHMPQECQDLPVCLQELLDLPVKAGHGTETLVLAGIVDGTAVEDITSTIAGQILGNAFPVGEAIDMDVKPAVRGRREAGALPGEFSQDPAQIRIASERFG